jgi:hypothetical protein
MVHLASGVRCARCSQTVGNSAAGCTRSFNVLDAVPSSLQPKVKAALHTITNAENKEAADLAIDVFEATYGAGYPKAVDKVLKDREVLLAHYDFPADHWVHLRTTNAIESTLATVKLRTRKTKAQVAGRPAWRWPTSSWRQPKGAGAPSTLPSWSHSFALAPRSWTASSSSAKASDTPRDHYMPIHNPDNSRFCRYVSGGR